MNLGLLERMQKVRVRHGISKTSEILSCCCSMSAALYQSCDKTMSCCDCKSAQTKSYKSQYASARGDHEIDVAMMSDAIVEA